MIWVMVIITGIEIEEESIEAEEEYVVIDIAVNMYLNLAEEEVDLTAIATVNIIYALMDICVIALEGVPVKQTGIPV